MELYVQRNLTISQVGEMLALIKDLIIETIDVPTLVRATYEGITAKE